jgi:hypothetical protein
VFLKYHIRARKANCGQGEKTGGRTGELSERQRDPKGQETFICVLLSFEFSVYQDELK